MPSDLLAAASALLVALAAAPAADPTAISIEAATERALAADPELRALTAETAAARVARAASGAWLAENPTLDAAAGRRRAGGDTSLDVAVELSQPFEVAGQRGARREASDARVRALEARLAGRRAALIAETREAFGRALAAGERLALEERAAALASEGLAATEERVRAGDASRIDENAARVELARARREVVGARRDRDRDLAVLRTLLGARPGEPIALAGTLEQLATRTTVSDSAAASLAPDLRPDVIAAREELRSARAERDLAGREAVPDVRLGAGYAHEEGADIVQGLLSFDLPLFQRNRAERAAASARVARAETALGAAGGRGAEEIRSALSRRDAARALVADSGGATLAAADENATLVREAYDAGKAGFLELLLVRRDALETRRAYLDALVELNSAEALLASALSGE